MTAKDLDHMIKNFSALLMLRVMVTCTSTRLPPTASNSSVVYMLVPIPSCFAVSLPMSSWSPAFTKTARSLHLQTAIVKCRCLGTNSVFLLYC